MLEKEQLWAEIVERVGILLNSMHPHEDLQKLIALEFTVNPEAKENTYNEVLAKVMTYLINFYHCSTLEELWTKFLLYEGVEAIENLKEVS